MRAGNGHVPDDPVLMPRAGLKNFEAGENAERHGWRVRSDALQLNRGDFLAHVV